LDSRGRGQKQPQAERRNKELVGVGAIEQDGKKIALTVDPVKFRVYIDKVKDMKAISDMINSSDTNTSLSVLQATLTKLDSERKVLHDAVVAEAKDRMLKENPKLNSEELATKIRQVVGRQADSLIEHQKGMDVEPVMSPEIKNPTQLITEKPKKKIRLVIRRRKNK
jgi:hypothetical protein